MTRLTLWEVTERQWPVAERMGWLRPENEKSGLEHMALVYEELSEALTELYLYDEAVFAMDGPQIEARHRSLGDELADIVIRVAMLMRQFNYLQADSTFDSDFGFQLHEEEVEDLAQAGKILLILTRFMGHCRAAGKVYRQIHHTRDDVVPSLIGIIGWTRVFAEQVEVDLDEAIVRKLDANRDLQPKAGQRI